MMPTGKSKRCGFSLVEVLIVIAIIGVLTGIMLPAVQRVRESANLTKCANNLKQMGLAFHDHQAVNSALPTAGGYCCGWEGRRTMINGTPANYQTQGWGWAYQILPYLEQNALYSNSDDGVIVAATPLLYYCPTLSPPMVNSIGDGMMHYGGCGGSGSGVAFDGILVPSAAYPGVRMTTSLNAIPDGVSNTIMLGEKALNLVRVQNGLDDCNNDEGWVDNWDNDTIVFGGLQPLPDSSITSSPYCGVQIGSTYPGSAFGSAHANGFQVLFADGSVHALSFNINQQVLSWLSTIADGNEIPGNSY